MSQWKFQLLPNEKGIIDVGYRMDEVGESVEQDVNEALRYPFKFHKVNKIVVCLGKPARSEVYIEILGVGSKQYDNFDAHEYVRLHDDEKVRLLRGIVLEVFEWFEANFDDADFIKTGRNNLPWAA